MTSHKIDVNQPMIFHSTKINSNRVLDLTDPQVVQKLGFSNKLKKSLLLRGDSKNSYRYSQILGDLAEEKGFDVIKVGSAIDKNGTNIVLLGGFE